MARLEAKAAIVTGASHGIGAAACEALAREGASMAVTDVVDEDGRAVADRIESAGGKAHCWHLDVTDEHAVKGIIDAVVSEFGKLNVLVNNAGIAGATKPTHEIELAEWDQVMDVNVRGVFLCTKHAVPYMRETGGGSIINLSSIYAIVSAPDIPPYHASKGAVRLMSKTDALLYAQDKIRVNSVHPGFIWARLVEELARQHPDGVEAFREEYRARHPIGHVGEPEDIAWGIVYLASDAAKSVTGSELVIDGGYIAR